MMFKFEIGKLVSHKLLHTRGLVLVRRWVEDAGGSMATYSVRICASEGVASSLVEYDEIELEHFEATDATAALRLGSERVAKELQEAVRTMVEELTTTPDINSTTWRSRIVHVLTEQANILERIVQLTSESC